MINARGLAGLGGTYSLLGGSLTSSNSNGGFIINPAGTFTENGGSESSPDTSTTTDHLITPLGRSTELSKMMPAVSFPFR